MKCKVCGRREADDTTGVCDTCKAMLTTIRVVRPMGANEYQQLAQRTSAATDMRHKLVNGALGLAGEAGEVADHIKKHQFQGHDLDKNEIVNECGDVLWYLAEILEGVGVSMEEAMRLNIDKLMRRYPDGFEVERSVNR